MLTPCNKSKHSQINITGHNHFPNTERESEREAEGEREDTREGKTERKRKEEERELLKLMERGERPHKFS